MSDKYSDLSEELKVRFVERTDTTKRIISIICLAIGVGLLIAAFTETAQGGALFYVGVLGGLALSLYGGIKAAFGCSVLTDSETGAKVETRSLYFQAAEKGNLLSALENEKWDVLKKTNSSSSTLPLCLKAWFTKDGGYASAMLMEYVPYQYVPVGRLREVSAASRGTFIGAIEK